MRATHEKRLPTGIVRLDAALGGGLLPGTLTVVIGATGVGKTQLGIQWCCRKDHDENSDGALISIA